MAALTIIGTTAFLVLLLSMSLTAGTQPSISALASYWRWLLLAALWSQILLLPQMLSMTPDSWQWMASLGIFAVIICGGANLYDKTDERVHVIAAVVAFTCLCGWVMVINGRCLLPLIVCICAGRKNWKWRVETGLIISVYITLILPY